MDMKNTKPKVCIGIPVYNGQEFIRKTIESLIAQTYSSFEIIISDNASTDNTQKICQEYCKIDSRIRYICHKKNMGPAWNFNFVLHKANSEFFMWNSIDDIREPTFLEKNVKALESNKNIVCSMSKAEFYGIEEELDSNNLDSKLKDFMIKIRSLKPVEIFSLSGTYEKKIRMCLKKLRMWVIYGIFRTELLQKHGEFRPFMGGDLPIILSLSRFGDFHIVDQNLTKFYGGGISKVRFIDNIRIMRTSNFEFIFPYYPLTAWCLKHLGSKIFLKNLDYFVELNLWGIFRILLDLTRMLINKATYSR